MRIFFDTEFSTLEAEITPFLISAGFVSEDGRQEFYAEIVDFPRDQCSQFVLEKVLPVLDAPESHRSTMVVFARRLADWLESFGEPVELHSDSPRDWPIIAAVLGNLVHALPLSTVVTRDRTFDALETEYRFWQQQENRGKQHHALHDARCMRLMRLASEGDHSRA